LKDNKALYTGKIDNPDPNAQVQTTTDAAGNTLVSSFPNDIDEFPIRSRKSSSNAVSDRFNIYCIVCHGQLGNADGMVVAADSAAADLSRRPLRNAPVGHFFDVMTNGWGKMNSYADNFRRRIAGLWSLIYARCRKSESGRDFENEF
jgi:hypothetical protein